VRFVAIFETEVVELFRFSVHAVSMPQVPVKVLRLYQQEIGTIYILRSHLWVLEVIAVWRGVCCGDRGNECRWDSHDGLKAISYYVQQSEREDVV
jgi:hypothetical protein